MTEAPRADLTKVPEEIASMFDSVATRYDMMDTLMTGGLNHVWMTALRKAVAPHPGERILDLAAGTGASAAALAKGGAEVVACDLSEGMIEVGRERHPELEFVHGNAMDLDFEDGSFDAVTISWGLRNIPDPALALREMARVVRPRGRLVILEFSTPPSRAFRRRLSCRRWRAWRLRMMGRTTTWSSRSASGPRRKKSRAWSPRTAGMRSNTAT